MLGSEQITDYHDYHDYQRSSRGSSARTALRHRHRATERRDVWHQFHEVGTSSRAAAADQRRTPEKDMQMVMRSAAWVATRPRLSSRSTLGDERAALATLALRERAALETALCAR